MFKKNHYYYYILVLTFAFYFTGCRKKQAFDTDKDALLKVENRYLYMDDLKNMIPVGTKPQDSISVSDRYIKKWVTDVLMYETAKRNIRNLSEIEKMVEEYRRSLIVHEYQQNLLSERLPQSLPEAELKSFYDESQRSIISNENYIKGLFLVVPASAPNLNAVRQWVRKGDHVSLESIEKYSLQNAISYDYFFDRWLDFVEIMRKLPKPIANPSGFISNNSFYETEDSSQHYFLKISEYRLIGDVEPFEIAKDKIETIILNQRRYEFMSTFEEELYNDAVSNKKILFFNQFPE
ncbi:MAG: peptidyl-prolyl cis-trans isomerase [Prevotellaceae bacterium]|nr:peptidyl-prolyl cis-trans isomerase [Prevotellaceae bacterium]